ncbi:hypothetical protein BV25DRAFT_1700283 [Artomyces pyxidatus]|uniref:Uncharacterized protein n=1 Tax=Artomyces pyxidatus TaxID=48021 RepID=A0ACB8T9J4_9AGAM|nr:hypothetical protein BV25DRAFT_1700283 [Artomyces pyxidatus]
MLTVFPLSDEHLVHHDVLSLPFPEAYTPMESSTVRCTDEASAIKIRSRISNQCRRMHISGRFYQPPVAVNYPRLPRGNITDHRSPRRIRPRTFTTSSQTPTRVSQPCSSLMLGRRLEGLYTRRSFAAPVIARHTDLTFRLNYRPPLTLHHICYTRSVATGSVSYLARSPCASRATSSTWVSVFRPSVLHTNGGNVMVRACQWATKAYSVVSTSHTAEPNRSLSAPSAAEWTFTNLRRSSTTILSRSGETCSKH